MKTLRSIMSIMVIVVSLIGLNLVSCSGGGGGGGSVVEDTPVPPASGAGTGAGGIPIFWMAYGEPNVGSGGASVQQTSDGGFIAAGSQMGGVYLIKTNASGAMQWEKTIGGGNTSIDDSANCIRQTSDGGYVIAGLHRSGVGGAETREFYLLRIDANGNALPGWPKTYPGLLPGDVIESQGQSGPEGFVFVGSSADNKAFITKVGPDGNMIWSTLVPHDPIPGGDAANAIVQNPDGGYTVAGSVQKFGTPNYVRVVRTDRDGNILAGWPKTYGIGTAFDVKSTQDGGFILAGTTSGGSPNEDGDALVIKLDNQGNESWRTISGGSRDDAAYSVAPLSGGTSGYIVAGKSASYSQADTNETRMYEVDLIKLDANGNKVWEKVKGIDPNSYESAGEVQLVSDGGYIVAGSSQNHFLLAKMDANGDTINLGTTDLTISVPGTTGIIKFDNAIETAAAAVSGLTKPRVVGSTALDLLIDTLNGVTDFCSSGTYTFNPLPTAPLTPGSSFALTFTSCATGPVGDQSTINGGLTLGVDAVNGNPLVSASSYTVQTTLTSINLSITDTVGTSTMTGGTRFQRAAAGGVFNELAQSIVTPAPQAFTWSESSATINRTHVIGPFTANATVTSTSFSFGATTDTLTVNPGLGPLGVTVVQPVEGGVPGSAPTTGIFKAAAPDGSQLTATVTNGVAALAVDTNADGTVDGTISVPWDSLD